MHAHDDATASGQAVLGSDELRLLQRQRSAWSGTLFAFAAGRYYEPRIEERALLFIDMRSSTAIAERLSELGFLNLLNRFIVDLSLAIAEAGGEIHKYVGDEVIATWRLAPA